MPLAHAHHFTQNAPNVARFLLWRGAEKFLQIWLAITGQGG
jgi:hypothetical protein